MKLKLTEDFIKKLPISENIGKKFFDEEARGLYLFITSAGSRCWRYNFKFYGRNKTLSLGIYPVINLKKARNALYEAKLILANGKDPCEEKKALKTQRTKTDSFEEIASDWYLQKFPEWKNQKHAKQVFTTISQLFPKLGRKPISTITQAMIYDALKIFNNHPETYKKVKQRVKMVFEYAILTGKASSNPVLNIPNLKKREVKHQPALPKEKICEFFTKLEEYPSVKVQLAIKLLILTFVRVGELRLGEWSEIKGNEWHIPAEKMKMNRDHIVPLSDWALEILEELKKLAKNNLIICGKDKKPISDSTLSVAMRNGIQWNSYSTRF